MFLACDVYVMQALVQTEEYQYIQQKVKSNPVMVFSKTTCSYCKMAKNVLNEIGVNYELEEIDLRKDTDKLQDIFAKITDARTVSIYGLMVVICCAA
jgi:glutaredoxin-related protein